jgi:hypothetical protein
VNRRELLRELSRAQATWVNRHTPGTGDVDIAVEDEQAYLTQISKVFERARADIRRKRGRDVQMAAQAAIDAVLAGYDPNQPRDRKGRWSEREGNAPSAPSAPDKPSAPSKPSADSAPKSPPVAKPRPAPEPVKAKTPAATLAAAPKDVEADSGPRKVSKAGTAAIERYRGKAFSEINGDLRSGKISAKTRATVDEIDKVHAESKLDEDVVLHRGIGNVEAVFGPAAKKKLTGAEWTEDAFQSTSADPAVAERFTINEDGKRAAAVIKMRVPKGTGAIQLSDERYEAEVLLERGLKLRVISDTGPWRRGQKGFRTIEVEVVPA